MLSAQCRQLCGRPGLLATAAAAGLRAPATKPNAAAQLAEGFAYLRVTPAIRTLLLLLGAISLLVLPYNTLLPVFAQRVFQGDAATFGYVNAFIGLGAVAGTAFLATRQPGANLKRVLLINTVLLGLALILFSRTSFLPLALAVLAGFALCRRPLSRSRWCRRRRPPRCAAA